MTEKWMTCTTCKAIVQLNATGMCLGCQGGFAGQQEEDKYVPIETVLKTKEEKIAQLVERQKELENALKERKKPEDNIQEHKNRNGSRKTTKTSRRNSTKRRREKQEKEEGKINE